MIEGKIIDGKIREKLMKKILLKREKKVTEENIIGLIKDELPYNSVEIKKRGSKGVNGDK